MGYGLDAELDDDRPREAEREARAATRIQARYRGLQTRRSVNSTAASVDSSTGRGGIVGTGGGGGGAGGGGGRFGLGVDLGVEEVAPSAGFQSGGPVSLAAATANANDPSGRRVVSPARSMSDDDAAVAIQSSYRGYKTRANVRGGGLGGGGGGGGYLGDFRREATNTLMERQSKARLAEMQGVEPYGGGPKPSSRSAADEARAATRIQASFRGQAARRDLKDQVRGGGGGRGGGVGFDAGGLHRRQLAGGARLSLSGDAHGTSGGDAGFDLATRGGGGWEPHGAELKQWEQFTARQRARHVPAAPDGLHTTPHPRGYRVRILAVEAYPFGLEPYRVAARGNRIEVRAAVSFYDEATGSFHGATCSSVPEEVRLPPAATPGPVASPNPVATLDVQHDAYFVTRVADVRCLIVVEVVFVERAGSGRGEVLRETSGGWAAVPTLGVGGTEPSGLPNSAPMRSGSPRYLMWGRPREGQHPPHNLGAAKLHFIYEPCPAVLRAAPLLPDDFPVTYGDVVPGVLRFDASGRLTSDVAAVTSTLAAPLLAPLHRVCLQGLCLALPRGLADVIAASPMTAVALHGAAAVPLTPEALAADPAAVTMTVAASRALRLRVSVHNGRRFVGAPVELDQWVAVPGPGDGLSLAGGRHLSTFQPISSGGDSEVSVIRLTTDAVLEAVPEDVLVVLVVEVLYRAPGSSAPHAVLGWAPVCPFRPAPATTASSHWPAGASSAPNSQSGAAPPPGLELRVGPLEVELRRGRGPRDEPPVDWRSVVHAAPDVWRAVVRYGGAKADAIAVAFEMSTAADDTGHGGAAAAATAAAAERDAARHLLEVQERAALTIQSSFRGQKGKLSPSRASTEPASGRGSNHTLRPRQSQGQGQTNPSNPARESLSVERAKAEAALAAIQARASLNGPPLEAAAAQQQARAREQLGALSSLQQQQQLAQVAALAGDDRTTHMVHAQQQQQLAQLAAAMQAQLNQLADTIGVLNRSTDNLALAGAGGSGGAVAADAAAAAIQDGFRTYMAGKEAREQAAAARTIQGRFRESYTGGDGDGGDGDGGKQGDWASALALGGVGDERDEGSGGGGRAWSAADDAACGPAALPKAAARSLFSGGIAEGAPAPGLGGFTRATRARLHAAGADATLPPDVRRALQQGAAAEAAARGGPPPPTTDLTRERRDTRAVNEVIVQFLAYRKLDALNSTAALEEVHFTFNFFDFPAATSRPCRFTPSDAKPGEPQLLVPEGAPRDSRSFAAGQSARAGEAWFKFCVDGSGNSTGDRVADGHEAMQARRVAFTDYLATGRLHVDVWDGSSLMQHGTCAIDLAGLLRQGRESAEVLLEAPVMDHREAVAEEAAKGRRRRAALGAARGEGAGGGGSGPVGGGVARGALLVRLINIGRAPDPSLMPPATPGSLAGSDMHRRGYRLGDGDGNGEPGGDGDGDKHGPKRVRIRAVPESGGELAAALRGGAHTHMEENVPPDNADGRSRSGGEGGGRALAARRAAARGGDRSALQQQEARKLSREARLREIRGSDGEGGNRLGGSGGGDSRGVMTQYPEDEEHAVRGKLLNDIDSVRRRAKRSTVLQTLRTGLASRRTIRPSYGELCFFEHHFKSPVSRDCVFEVRCDDTNLMLVSSTGEWRGLRSSAGMAPGAPGMEDDALAGNRLFLLGQESIKVPFKFQSFDAEPESESAATESSQGMGDSGLHLRARTVAVHFVNTEDGSSAGVLHVSVRPRAMIVSRTFRFQAPAHDFFKARLPPPPGWPTRDANGDPCMAVRASDPAVAAGVAEHSASVRASASAAAAGTSTSAGFGVGAEEITLRYKCGGPPDGPASTSFYVCVYADRFLGTLAAVWRVFVHAVPRVDISALVGQTMHTSIVVPGGSATRRIAAFSSHPDELQVAPDRLVLPSGALTEVQLAFRPLVPGRLDTMVHLVDLERRELVHSRLVSTDARAPTVSKTFEVDLCLGLRAHKKITYTNPYPRARAFYLRCTHPLLLHFRPDRLDLPANGSRPMGLTFEPAEAWAAVTRGGGGAAEVLVFINDEEDATEECFRIRVIAANSHSA